MKEYTIQVGEIFTEQKAQELKEYLEAKDEEIKKLQIDCACKEPLPQLNFDALDERFDKKFDNTEMPDAITEYYHNNGYGGGVKSFIKTEKDILKFFLHQSLEDYHRKVMEVLEGMKKEVLTEIPAFLSSGGAAVWRIELPKFGFNQALLQAKDKIKEIEV